MFESRIGQAFESKKRVLTVSGLISLAAIGSISLLPHQDERVPAVVINKEDVNFKELTENNCQVTFDGQTGPVTGPFRDIEIPLRKAVEPMFPAITTSVQCGFSTNAGPKPSQPEVYLLDLNNCADESTKPECNYTVAVDKQTFEKNSIGSQFQP